MTFKVYFSLAGLFLVYITTMLSYAELECPRFQPPSEDCRLGMLTYMLPPDEEFRPKTINNVTYECCQEIRRLGWDCYIIWTQSETTKYDSHFLDNEAFLIGVDFLWRDCNVSYK